MILFPTERISPQSTDSKETYKSVEPGANSLDAISNRSADMLADLERIHSQLNVVIDKSEYRCEGPDDTPDGNVAELSDHFRIISCSYQVMANVVESKTY